MLLGDVIYNFRVKRKLTLKDFSKLSGLSVSYINQLEKNRNPKTNEPIVPSLETFAKVADAMGISLDSLLSAVDENQPVGLSQRSRDGVLSREESRLVELFRSLNNTGRERLIEQAELLASSSAFTVPDDADLVG